MEDGRTTLYRHCQGGVLVYDSRARRPSEKDSIRIPQKSALNPEVLKILEKVDAFDKSQFINMVQYPKEKFLPKEYTLVAPFKNTLVFDSNFESGNLNQAVKVTEDEYNLSLDFDTETQGYTQWYYFSVKNYKGNHTVRFNIVNLIKPNSLYTKGLKPLILSTQEQTTLNILWRRGGDDIKYFQNSNPRKSVTPGSNLYYFTLTFLYTFRYPNDKVFFAHCYPYTYSDLNNYLSGLSSQDLTDILKISVLCKTLSGNDCPLLTITENIHNFIENPEIRSGEKQSIVLTARVHPGETVASYVIEGFINFIVSDSDKAKILRQRFLFKIVPMLNIDGVIYGNNRCSLLGVDLNRRWKDPNQILHPTIFYVKAMINDLKNLYPVWLFCDVHGHSSKLGTFMYGCKSRSAGTVEAKENVAIRLVPLEFARRSDSFLYENCKFCVEKYKESAARVVVFREFGVVFSYTLEVSFMGSEADDEFNDEALKCIGSGLCEVIFTHRSQARLQKIVNIVHKNLLNACAVTSTTILSTIEGITPHSMCFFEIEALNNQESDSSSKKKPKKLQFRMNSSRIRVKKTINPKTLLLKSNANTPGSTSSMIPKKSTLCAPASFRIRKQISFPKVKHNKLFK